jgi:REP element-mobilizing transposase RayT
MIFNPEVYHRRSIRLYGFDYSSPGLYFVTICTQNRICLLGDFKKGILELNDAGISIKQIWKDLPQRFQHITLDEYVVMPNHIHGIIHIMEGPPFNAINDYLKNRGKMTDDMMPIIPGTTENSIGRILQGFKSITTHLYIQGVRDHDWEPFEGHLWQRNFYDHIIRNKKELEDIREYIMNNPSNWEHDEDNPNLIIT